MKKSAWLSVIILIIFLAATTTALANAPAVRQAQAEATSVPDEQPSGDDLVTGALLYDKWYAVLGVNPPSGNMPIWSRQSTNTRSGEDTWRCVECHGWDYKGREGAYGSGSHLTGFPNVMVLSRTLTVGEIVGHLKGSKDPAHNFSAYMDDATLNKVAQFLKFGLIDDDQYIDDISLKVIGGDLDNGKTLYQDVCAECHGEDGKTIVFRTEGVNEFLGTVANRDPWRFLHRTRFGTAGTSMPVGYQLGWTTDDGRDILAYSQTLPTGQESPFVELTPRGSGTPQPIIGGPATNFWRGILTGVLAFIGTLGGSLLFGGLLVAIIAIIVWTLRKRN